MAYVNVAEWSPDQVADWLKGLDSSILQYIPSFLDNEVKGQQLLNVRSEDLENLGILSIGHQEFVLEAVKQLRHFHYELDRENLQYLALKLSCVATSLYNELLYHEHSHKVVTQTLSDVTNIIGTVRPLACWLERSPFSGLPDYMAKKAKLVSVSQEMAIIAVLDRFAERPLQAIRAQCRELAALADSIVQDISDPMILQPASLDLATLKKRDHELGFEILSSCNGIHQVTDIKFGSPAHSSGKIEDGDEIVQVNYQTVVGWEPKEVLLLCQESPADVLLTLKKRPKHTHTYGQIYMKPYRLPSRKRSVPFNRWGSLPSPRPELLTIRAFEMNSPRCSPVPTPMPAVCLEGSSSSDESEILSRPGSPTSDHMSSQPRIYLPKPRSVVQRRNTTSGSSPVSKRPNISIEQFWKELNSHKTFHHTGSAQMTRSKDADDISDNLYRRDKSVSCSTGLELSPRPKTCLGVGLNHSKVIKAKEKIRGNCDDKAVNKTVKFHDQLVTSGNDTPNYDDLPNKEPRERGKLDKSYSTPAYDFGEGEVDDNEYPLMNEVIPESPTSSIDSPTIIVHSPKKVDQILEFKKSSEQIGGAMMYQKSKDKFNERFRMENNFGEVQPHKSGENTKSDEKVDQILETINIALLQHKKDLDFLQNKSSLNPGQNIFETEFGGTDSKRNHHSEMSEKIQAIQNELVEAINEQRKLDSLKGMSDLKTIPQADMPPEPPPRPLSTQKPGYIPPKPTKHIQKQDIQVIPNVDPVPPIIPLRKDIPLPLNNSYNNMPGSTHQGLLHENKHSINASTSELSSPRLPMTPSISLQRLEVDQKMSSAAQGNKPETPVSVLKSPNFEAGKLTASPANSMVRGILNSGKSKSLKKKNSILAKRRKVSVKDLGMGDMQGHLYQRCRTKTNSNVNWELRWFILLGNTFYGFKSRDATKADCLIFLSGFTVTDAQEVKSREFAFKVYHTGTVFYFSCESSDSRAAWIECITRATLTNNDSWERASKKDKKTEESKHYSETDYSDDDLSNCPAKADKGKGNGKQEKGEKSHKFGSLKKFTTRMNKSDSQENVNHASTSLDRKYLGFFTSRYNKNKEEKAKFKNNDTPVPTDQYRSYRKIPLVGSSMSCLSPARFQPSRSENKITQAVLEESPEKSSQLVAKIIKLEPIETQNVEKDILPDLTVKNQKKVHNPINYIHASNPNLLDFEKSDFVTKPKHKNTGQDMVHNAGFFVGFVTLEQFMLKKQEEERIQVYSNRVLMGVERDARTDEQNLLKQKQKRSTRDNLQRQLDKIVPDVIYGENPLFMEKNITPAKMEQIQNRCLPKTPDIINSKSVRKLSDSLSPNTSGDCQVASESLDAEAVKGESKRTFGLGLKKKNDGYETINYDETCKFVSNSEASRDYSFGSLNNAAAFPKTKSINAVKDGYEKIDYGDNCERADDFSIDMPNGSSLINNTFDKSKELGYELLYDDKQPLLPAASSNVKKNKTGLIDLGYETIYDKDILDLLPNNSDSNNSSFLDDDNITVLRKLPNESKRPTPPPKISKAKVPVNRQNSLTSVGDRKSSGIDTKPVFKQGDSPEKFWLDSLRRNDKTYASKHTNEHSAPLLKSDKFYTKHSEPSTYMKSSEATIVKSEKLQSKNLSSNENSHLMKIGEHKPLKSATQYTPMSLPLVTPNKALKTSPQFELSLDSREAPVTPAHGISRIRQMFQHGVSSKVRPASPKEKTLLGSPLLHRAIFRKNNTAPPDESAQDFVYSKGSPAPPHPDTLVNESYLFCASPGGSVLTSGGEGCSVRNASTPDYSHLECPPVFEAETYTLTIAGPSISRRKNNYDTEE